ncbi:MAG: dihydropteroate synthase [Xanthomonadaceae bacterium]|nr:dihydropteroate synthase [Xanthomonadaceae bacterium]
MFELAPTLHCGPHRLVLDRPRVMGIVNVTPDSFADGGHHASAEAAVAHALRLVEEGADLLDVGGESTRPGAAPVDEATELARVLPVIEALAARVAVPVGVDTRKPAVMRAALAAGASFVNDVNALRAEGALEAVAASQAAVVLMHMAGEPASMQQAPHYGDVVGEVHRFLTERVFACEMAGIDKRRIAIDPGFGFGKTLDHNLALLAQLERFTEIGVPVLAGLSRKSSLGEITGRAVADRLPASLAAHLVAVRNGAAIVRVHDVAATVDALKVWQAVAAVPVPKDKTTGPAIRWPDED